MIRLLLAALALGAAPAWAEEAAEDPARFGPERHGLSIFGDLKYPPGFAHFDYANPAAPKGGTLSQVGPRIAYNASFLTFDSLNGYILKGQAPQGLRLVFDSLMTRAQDEPDAVYGLLAASVALSADRNQARFTLRPGIRFHDGSPLTAQDAAFSLMLLKAHGHPLIARPLAELAEARALDERRLLLRFTGRQTRDLILFAAQLPVFSRAYYETHDFTRTTLEPPPGSGPYRIGRFQPGRFITYERAADYWGRDVPVNRGRWNFDRIRFEYFRDRTSQFEAFKAGAYLLREEFTSKVWATQYDFPARRAGRVKTLIVPDQTPSGAQGWFINMRRARFQDVRVRAALALAFDFEWANRNQFYGLYRRTDSYFENTAMKARGAPAPDESALLAPLAADLPPGAASGPAVRAPRSDGSGRDRENLRRARALLRQAGWRVEDGRLRDSQGRPFPIEFLTDAPSFERILAPYIRNLQRLGIQARIRLVDAAQYQERVKQFDFDMVSRRFTIANTPGVELRAFLASAFAGIPGSYNLAGIANPAVDALVEQVIAAPTRAAQITAARALDRVLRALHVWVPHWHKPSHHLAFWDVFARPARKPAYDRAIIDCWWIDLEKSRALGKGL